MSTNIFMKLSKEQILALCIYGEARGESREGQIAVGSVVLERLDRKTWYGKTLHTVILMPFQFSCFLANDPNYPKLVRIAERWPDDNKSLLACYQVAGGLLDGTIKRSVKATHYKTLNCKASWEKSMKKVVEIGHHAFFI